MLIMKTIIDKIRKTYPPMMQSQLHLDELYLFSKKSYILLFVLSCVVTYVLYPLLGSKIFIWFIIHALLILYRGYNTYLYYTNNSKYTEEVWYRKFVIYALSTALLYSILGMHHIQYLDKYHQIFIVLMLLGLAGGSSSALSQNRFLAISYILILLFPVTILLPFLSTMPLHLGVTLMLITFGITQITVINRIHHQNEKISTLGVRHEMLHSLFKNAPLGVLTYNTALDILECNDALVEIFKNTKENILQMNLGQLPDARAMNAFKKGLLGEPSSYKGEYISVHGNHYWLDIKAFKLMEEGESTSIGIGIIEDKTREHNAIQALEYMSEHDMLTQLLNRRGTMNALMALAEDEKHHETHSVLFYLDLNRFKSINDTLGHNAGDEVLLAVSMRLKKIFDEAVQLGRLGGDEFVVLCPHIDGSKEGAKGKADALAQKISHAFAKPFIIQESALHITISIGIVLIEPGDVDFEEIMRHADLSMYKAKTVLDNISYYDETLDREQKKLFYLKHELAYATKRNQFKLYFQPIVEIKSEALKAAELLIRWEHPSKGTLTPGDFIPLAIKIGLLSSITWWIIDKACLQIAKWKESGNWKLEYISINIDAEQLLEVHFASNFLKKLKLYGIETSEIMLEITEQSLIDNFTNAQSVINELKHHGIKCAIDDFGIGYSSLSYLKKLSFHTLKIDREFVKDIERNQKEFILMRTILDVGRQFEYNIIIEGIEKIEQKTALMRLDDKLYYQGYLYSEPLHIEAFTKYFLE